MTFQNIEIKDKRMLTKSWHTLKENAKSKQIAGVFACVIILA